MPDKLVIGSNSSAKSPTILESVIPFLSATNLTLIPHIHRLIISDTTGATRAYTLPDGASSNGVVFMLKRNTVAGSNFAHLLPLGGDKIDVSDDFILGNRNEFVEVGSDGTSIWKVISFNTNAIAALQFTNVTPATQAVTDTFAVINAWDFNGFSTPGRLVADQASNKFSVINIQGDRDGYKVFFEGSIRYQNNVDIDIAIFVNGDRKAGQTITGKGANDVFVSFQNVVVALTSDGVPQDIDIRVRANTDNTITYNTDLTTVIERIGG